MGKKIMGVCRICGKERELTKEHVPPRSTNNKTTRYTSISMDKYYSKKNPMNYEFKGKTYQGGIGFHSLCGNCNSFLGSNYVESYREWVKVGLQVLKSGDFERYGYDVDNLEPLKIIKQILSMFLSLNGEWYWKEYNEISQFISNPKSKELSNRFQLYTYLNNEGNTKYIPHQTKRLSNGIIINGTEISFPPYGYVLLIDGEYQIKNLNNITYFKEYSLGEKTTLSFDMRRLPTYSQSILEYPMNK